MSSLIEQLIQLERNQSTLQHMIEREADSSLKQMIYLQFKSNQLLIDILDHNKDLLK
jgi:hypothetical protein